MKKTVCSPSANMHMTYRYFELIGIQTCIVLVLLGLVLAALFNAYYGTYVSYSSACVSHSTNSSFLIRNVNSLAYNYASMDGNAQLSEGIRCV